MPETPPRITRAAMSPEERHLRSQLVQLLSGAGLLRATLNPRQKVCGKSGCRCARGEKHSALYVVASEDGKPQQLFVPHTLEPQARQWVSSYQRIRELLEQLSRIYWDKLSRREP
ncbi:MAG TPA: DUF6788 family protein [Gemmatimonadales bacterium]|nr:DUF6788 family protein [Gemmatimonadales bacterium]